MAWQDEIYDAFVEANIRQVAFVPDAGHKEVIRRCLETPSMRAVSMTTEEDGIALLAGAWLGGDRGAMLMQSSGVGNCINMLSLTKVCQFPLVTLVTMRGEWGEFNTWQIPMGRTTEAHLELCGVACYRCDTSESVGDTVRTGIRYAYNTNSAVAVLLGQKLIGAKVFEAGRPEGDAMSELHRREVVKSLLSNRGDTLVVTGLGQSTYDAYAAGDDPRTFYLWGAMGGSVPIGLGMAIAQPDRRVLVVTGDGELLMGLGSLSVVGAERPKNLAVVVLDNGKYGETGQQVTHTARGTDLAGVAKAAGFREVFVAEDEATVRDGIRIAREGEGPVFVLVRISDEPVPMVLPPKDGAFLKTRFRQAVVGDDSVS